MKIDLLRLRHDRHRTGGGMDTSSRLCFGHTLHTVYAALILQSGVSACSVDHESHFLESADPVLIQTEHLGLPATPLRVLHIHPVYLRREKSRFVSAGSGADLHDNILVIVGVFGQEQDLKLMLQFFHLFPRVSQLFLQHLSHFLVFFFVQHRETVLNGFFIFLIFSIGIHYRLKLALFLHKLLKTVLVICHSRLAQLIQDLVKTDQQILQFIKHIYPPELSCYIFCPSTTLSSPVRSFTVRTPAKPASLRNASTLALWLWPISYRIQPPSFSHDGASSEIRL